MLHKPRHITEEVKHIPEYDGIRGMAIIMVLIWHCFNNLIVNREYPLFKFFLFATSKFWSGVDLFFVLSGFLLGGILLKQKDTGSFFSTFYIRRICRIFPLYYSFLLIYFLLFNTSLRDSMPWVFNKTLPFWCYASFTQNFMMAKHLTMGSFTIEPTWSLAVEEQFYLFIPLVVYFIRGKKLLIFIAVLSAASLYFRLTAPNWYAAFSLLHCRADALLLGVLAAYITINQQTQQLLFNNKKIFYLLFYSIIILLAANSFLLIKINYYFNFSLQAILFMLLMLLPFIDKGSRIVTFLKNRFLRHIGKYSFGIYIYHYFITGIVHYTILNHAPQISNVTNLLVTLFAMVILYLVAVLSYHLMEKKFIAFGHRYVYT